MIARFLLWVLALGTAGCDVVASTPGDSGAGGAATTSTSSTSSGSGGDGTGGCSPSSGSGEGDTFIAFASDFAGYHGWESFPLGNGSPSDPVHDMGPLTAYLNKRPPCGATEFPVGTIIVKELEKGPVDTRTVFAAVKRGADYNAMGAKNWEWFELLRNDAPGDTVRIVWGAPQPTNQMYSGAGKDCNGCHVGAEKNDFIWAAPLDLKKLEGSENTK